MRRAAPSPAAPGRGDLSRSAGEVMSDTRSWPHLDTTIARDRVPPDVRRLATEDTMRRLALGLFCAASLAAQAMAQDRILHVGLREDPDLLDPTLGSSYVGRIVFSGICDKLFDIDAKLNIVPVLATGYEWKDPTHLVIHIRDGVQFQDGEKLERRSGEVQADARPERQGQHAARRGQLDRQHRCD